MRTPNVRLSIALAIVITVGGCTKSDDPSPGSKTKSITTTAEAKAVYSTVKSFLSGFESKLTSSSSTTTVNGTSGKATISGSKTSGSSSTSSSSTSTSTIDMQVNFQTYSSFETVVNGSVKNYNYYYYRSACSSSACASSTTVNQYIRGTGIVVEFTYDGKAIKDTISIDVEKTSSYGTLSGKVTTSSGTSFTI